MIKIATFSLTLFITTANFTMLQELPEGAEYKIHAATAPLKESETKKVASKSKSNRCCMLFLDCLTIFAGTPGKPPMNIAG